MIAVSMQFAQVLIVKVSLNYNRLSDKGFCVSGYPIDCVRNTAFLLAMSIDCASVIVHYWPSVIGKGRQ